METVCIFIAIICVGYVIYLHKDCDRTHEENTLLRQTLHKLAMGEANIYMSNGTVRIEEVK